MAAIVPGALYLDINPMDSPLWVLDGVGNPMISGGYSLFVELVGYDVTLGHTVNLYYATDGYNDPSAPAYFEPRMSQSLTFRRDLFSGNTTGGAGRISFGEMRLANDDGALDGLRTSFAFAGWPAKFLIGDPSQAYSTFETLISGKPLQAFFSVNELSVALRDRLQDLQQPLQITKYLGDNVLPNGLEGGINLKDKLKPRVYGMVQNVQPIIVNTAKLIFQINDGPIAYLPMVYDRGVALTLGADYTSQADMMANQPTAGQFRVLKAEGYFRLGATPSGAITCDAADVYTLDGTERDIGNTPAQVAKRIVIRPAGSDEGGLVDTDIDAGDVAALDISCQQVVGIYCPDQTSYAQALDTILGSVGVWYVFDRFDKFRMQRLEPPIGGTGVCTFKMFGTGGTLGDAGIQDFDITDIRFLPTSDPDRGIPSWEIELQWGLNYTVQSRDNLAGSVTADRREFLISQYRTAKSQMSSLKDAYPLAISKKVTTTIIDGTDAQNEADRLLAIYSTQKDFVEIDTPLTSELVGTVDIGMQVVVTLSRFEYQAGKAMRVIGMQYNPGSRGCTLALWG
jgi:hypothetical protein